MEPRQSTHEAFQALAERSRKLRGSTQAELDAHDWTDGPVTFEHLAAVEALSGHPGHFQVITMRRDHYSTVDGSFHGPVVAETWQVTVGPRCGSGWTPVAEGWITVTRQELIEFEREHRMPTS